MRKWRLGSFSNSGTSKLPVDVKSILDSKSFRRKSQPTEELKRSFPLPPIPTDICVVLKYLVEFLTKHKLHKDELFVVDGKPQELRRLLKCLYQGDVPEKLSQYSSRSISSAILHVLSSSTYASLLPFTILSQLCQANHLTPDVVVTTVTPAVEQLPTERRVLVESLLLLLYKLALKDTAAMNAQLLGQTVGSCLVRPDEDAELPEILDLRRMLGEHLVESAPLILRQAETNVAAALLGDDMNQTRTTGAAASIPCATNQFSDSTSRNDRQDLLPIKLCGLLRQIITTPDSKTGLFVRWPRDVSALRCVQAYLIDDELTEASLSSSPDVLAMGIAILESMDQHELTILPQISLADAADEDTIVSELIECTKHQPGLTQELLKLLCRIEFLVELTRTQYHQSRLLYVEHGDYVEEAMIVRKLCASVRINTAIFSPKSIASAVKLILLRSKEPLIWDEDWDDTKKSDKEFATKKAREFVVRLDETSPRRRLILLLLTHLAALLEHEALVSVRKELVEIINCMIFHQSGAICTDLIEHQVHELAKINEIQSSPDGYKGSSQYATSAESNDSQVASLVSLLVGSPPATLSSYLMVRMLFMRFYKTWKATRATVLASDGIAALITECPMVKAALHELWGLYRGDLPLEDVIEWKECLQLCLDCALVGDTSENCTKFSVSQLEQHWALLLEHSGDSQSRGLSFEQFCSLIKHIGPTVLQFASSTHSMDVLARLVIDHIYPVKNRMYQRSAEELESIQATMPSSTVRKIVFQRIDDAFITVLTIVGPPHGTFDQMEAPTHQLTQLLHRLHLSPPLINAESACTTLKHLRLANAPCIKRILPMDEDSIIICNVCEILETLIVEAFKTLGHPALAPLYPTDQDRLQVLFEVWGLASPDNKQSPQAASLSW
ncbi:hypothetical protein Poli38472_002476 [Pythium oligandrum]|uniref:Rho-GAP domain-containing protein n=1 Tax=Pythium oligandrum TaxID=41045 RepID=A0A8K1CHX0_PYTOL|nr:hypothetical protein Poli38472_002476 [Pythium oligandrum]|eukprot:TMW63535.1 hypothetical protein Poli38472_002476 [Pythium oligandrum]